LRSEGLASGGLATQGFRGRLAVWLWAARLRTLPAAIVPVIVGLALARREGPLDLKIGITTLAAALLIQIGTNLANDYYDFVAGADTAGRLGPLRITQAGLAAPAAVKRAAFGVLALAALLGIYLVATGGWPILGIGVAALLCAVGYSTGPYPLAYHGLGEPFVFLFFGVLAVPGTAYLQTGHIDELSLLAALPVACVVTAILVVNNVRDVVSDGRAGKRTFAVRFGERAARVEYVALIVSAFAVLPAICALAGSWCPALAFLALPFAISEVRAFNARTGAALNLSLAGTARLHLIFGILLALGFAL
jgi:1,4-dihydroxy-2-naphthoate octaprenyltransferase